MKSSEHQLQLFLDKKGGLREDFLCMSVLEDVRNKDPYNHCTSQQETQSKRQLTSLVSQFLGDFLLLNSEEPQHQIIEAKEGLPISENKFQKYKNKTGKDRLSELLNRNTNRERRY